MKELIEKLRELELEIAADKGEFALFAVLLRAGSPERWDLLVSSPWLESNQKEGLEYLAKRVGSVLNEEEKLLLSMIVILERGNPVLEAIRSSMNCFHGDAEFIDCTFNKMKIKHAFIITSSREVPAKCTHRDMKADSKGGSMPVG